LPDQRGQMSAKATASLGLPDGFKSFSPAPFGGMNVQSSPVAMADQEFLWLENLVRLGDGNLRTVWDRGAPIYTATGGRTIVWYSFFNIGTVYYCAVFLSDGSAVQIDMATLAQTAIGPAATFYLASTGYLPYARQWGTQYLLICNRNTSNDFWAWDGALLYGAGTAAPNGVDLLSIGAGYSSQPSLTIYGGSGSGMAITPQVASGSIVEMTITNPGSGYEPGDVVQIGFSGGGSNSSAILTASLSATTVAGVTITAQGSGYTAATVAFSGGGGGTGAAGTVTVTDGNVTGITITNGGSGYTTAPIATISGDGSGAKATVQLTPAGLATGIVATSVQHINLTAGGGGYVGAPYVLIQGGGGTGAAATATVTSFNVTSITLTSGGSGYTSVPEVLLISTTGSGATATAVLTPSASQIGITVVNGGSGFTTVPLITIEGGGGAGATAIAVLTATSVASVNLTSGGSGYTSQPTVTFTGGGSGSGAAATAVLNGDQIGYVTVTNGGSNYTAPIQVVFTGGGGTGAGGNVLYAPTSIGAVDVSSAGEFYTTAPTVLVQPGANNSAYATVTLMPYGVSGAVMETFLSRLWIFNPAPSLTSTLPPGGNWQISAPGSFVDFATSDGGVQALNTDAFLDLQYTQVRQSSGYLYALGNGSVSVVSNVNSSGSPVSTTYNYQNVDPQAGCAWRDSLQDFGRSEVFANATGVYGLYGGAATKISGKLDQLFTNAIFPPAAGAITPSAAIATIFSIKHYLLLMTVRDPDTFETRNVMVTWNEKDWVVTTQSINLAFVATEKQGSVYEAYGTDGTSLCPLFSTPSTSLVKRFDTKFYGGDRPYIEKAAQSLWLQGQDNSASEAGITGMLQAVISGIGGGVVNGFSETVPEGVSAPFLNEVAFASPAPYWNVWGTAIEGNGFMSMGLRFTSASPDFTLANIVIGYTDHVAFYA
jgi:hypothetical protein